MKSHKLSSWSDGARASGPVIFSFWPLVFILVAVMLSGCVTTKERGDRAFEAQQYNEALDHYEKVIDTGSDNPELYFRAAKAAVRVGDFALAERYYSRALRHGGGEEVVRSLAEFYIATSNYTKAVRVLQQLLEKTDNPQSVFNNLGTALMYADAPIDAESYLLIAQQMEPTDPVPYLNLGVLYDKYLHQPQQALGFYKCFLEMSEQSNQRRKISTRVDIYEKRFQGRHKERFGVECGEPYRGPKALSNEEIREKLEALKGIGPENLATGDPPDTPDDGRPEDQRPVDKSSADTNQPVASGAEDVDGEDAPPVINRGSQAARSPVELAQKAYKAQNYKEAVTYLEQVPIGKLDADAMSLHGRALIELDEHARAQRWLAGAVDEDPSPENVEALLEVYRALKADEEIVSLCERFDDEPELEDVLEQCPQREIRRQLRQE